jgi:PAS domain S-box-containing protein
MESFGPFGDLAHLFDGITDAHFWIKDRESRFLACNRAFAEHFGFSGFGELAGRTDLDVSPEHLAREYINDDKAVVTSGRPIRDKMELVQDGDDSLNWYATTKVPIRDAQGRITGTAGVTRKVLRVEEETAPGGSLDKAVKAINTRYGEGWNIPDLAAIAGMSMDNFERKFKLLLRETPLRYLNRIRMRAACGLLIHSEISIGEIAGQCGFADQSYFTKRFFAHFRVKPMEYRRKYGKKTGNPGTRA